MADDDRDTLMKIEVTSGKYVPGECSAVAIAPDDPMAKDFSGTQVTGGLINGNYFAVDDFSVDIGIKGQGTADQMEAQSKDTQEQISEVTKQVNKTVEVLTARIKELETMVTKLGGDAGSGKGTPKIGTDGGSAGEFSRFMLEGRSFLRKEKKAYPSDLEPVSITKRMDISSPVLFDKCQSSFKFVSATVLKRKAVGKNMLYGFLRIDFTDVMLIELNWDDDDVTKETFKFVCRKAVVTYAMENPSTDKANKGAAVLTQMPAVEWNVLPPAS